MGNRARVESVRVSDRLTAPFVTVTAETLGTIGRTLRRSHVLVTDKPAGIRKRRVAPFRCPDSHEVTAAGVPLLVQRLPAFGAQFLVLRTRNAANIKPQFVI